MLKYATVVAKLKMVGVLESTLSNLEELGLVYILKNEAQEVQLAIPQDMRWARFCSYLPQ